MGHHENLLQIARFRPPGGLRMGGITKRACRPRGPSWPPTRLGHRPVMATVRGLPRRRGWPMRACGPDARQPVRGVDPLQAQVHHIQNAVLGPRRTRSCRRCGKIDVFHRFTIHKTAQANHQLEPAGRAKKNMISNCGLPGTGHQMYSFAKS